MKNILSWKFGLSIVVVASQYDGILVDGFTVLDHHRPSLQRHENSIVLHARRKTNKDESSSAMNPIFESIRKTFIASTLASVLAFGGPIPDIEPQVASQVSVLSIPSANAEDGTRIIGQLKGSGLIFKDTLQIESFDDPKVKGVKLYISTFQIPITERFGKNMFSDPSYASVTCARTGGPVAIASNIARGPSGEEVFEERKSLFFKELRVYRIFDEEANTVVYVSFNTRFDKSDDSNKSRFKSSLCAINLDDPPTTTTATIASTATSTEAPVVSQ